MAVLMLRLVSVSTALRASNEQKACLENKLARVRNATRRCFWFPTKRHHLLRIHRWAPSLGEQIVGWMTARGVDCSNEGDYRHTSYSFVIPRQADTPVQRNIVGNEYILRPGALKKAPTDVEECRAGNINVCSIMRLRMYAASMA